MKNGIPTLESDCLYNLQDESDDAAQKQSSSFRKEGVAPILSNPVVIAAIIIGVALIIAALIIRSSGGARYKAIGTSGGMILDTKTGIVHRTRLVD